MMKVQKIMGWERYQVYSDDDRPICIIEMGPASSDTEKRLVLDTLIDLHEAAQQNEQGKPALTKEDMFAMFCAGRNSAGLSYPYPLMQIFEEALQEYEAAQQEEGE